MRRVGPTSLLGEEGRVGPSLSKAPWLCYAPYNCRDLLRASPDRLDDLAQMDTDRIKVKRLGPA